MQTNLNTSSEINHTMATFTTGIPWMWTLWGEPPADPMFPTVGSSSKDRITETQQLVPPKPRLPLAVAEPRLRRHLAAPLPLRLLPRELPAEVSCFLPLFWQSKDKETPYAKYNLSTKGVKRNSSFWNSYILKAPRAQNTIMAMLWACQFCSSTPRDPERCQPAILFHGDTIPPWTTTEMEALISLEGGMMVCRGVSGIWRVVWWYVKLSGIERVVWFMFKSLSVLGGWFDYAS